jgi:hypothetical protein
VPPHRPVAVAVERLEIAEPAGIVPRIAIAPVVPAVVVPTAIVLRDTNRDGRLTPREWRGDDEAFERLDLDRDGFLSWDEVLERERRRR